ncbi:MAG: release factor glutamine methyltransferase [Cyclobacteriaceae bacterium]|jgi:release factor glutamine methyltransferase
MELRVSAIYKETVHELSLIYGEREAEIIANMLFEDLLLIPKTSRIIKPNHELTVNQISQINEASLRLKKDEPIQHILGQAHFYNRVFKVNKNTLIPRPETEELVDLIKNENRYGHLSILDIGTGTGCIAISLAKELHLAVVKGIDISDDALKVAKENAGLNEVEIEFQKIDILQSEIPWKDLDIIVSNPPYIPNNEKVMMNKNVTNYEPHLALFVPNEDSLLFYRAIAEKGLKSLKADGKLYFEIHESFGKETSALLEQIGYSHVTIIQDMQCKDRMIRAVKEI